MPVELRHEDLCPASGSHSIVYSFHLVLSEFIQLFDNSALILEFCHALHEAFTACTFVYIWTTFLDTLDYRNVIK